MTKVKICGLSTQETMQAALDSGADMVGLVFYPKSPRNVSMSQAKALAEQARGKAAIVVLVVDADDALLLEIYQTLRPDYLQAHGNETPERIAAIHALTKIPIIKAIKVERVEDVASAEAYKSTTALILFDAKAPKGLLPGGNGLSFDWRLLAEVRGQFMLSGGLDVKNIAQAIKLTRAAMVDVSSGVESAPGVKDVELIAKFIKAAHKAGNED
jgi:phosphoribosylanthranilate isomerase